MTKHRWLTVEETATVLKMSERSIRRLIKSGKLKGAIVPVEVRAVVKKMTVPEVAIALYKVEEMKRDSNRHSRTCRDNNLHTADSSSNSCQPESG